MDSRDPFSEFRKMIDSLTVGGLGDRHLRHNAVSVAQQLATGYDPTSIIGSHNSISEALARLIALQPSTMDALTRFAVTHDERLIRSALDANSSYQLATKGLATDYASTAEFAGMNSAFQSEASTHNWALIKGLTTSQLYADALRAGSTIQSLNIPGVLGAYRPDAEFLAAQLMVGQAPHFWDDPSYLSAFGQASAMSKLIAEHTRITSEVQTAIQAFSTTEIPDFLSLVDYRDLLDSAGLHLSRLPNIRLLTAAERRRRLRAEVKRNAPAPHIKKATSLVHGYERTLRDVIDQRMADEYGDDWAEERLPACGCKDLLVKWKKRGGEGNVLDHADYTHYGRIMSYPDHWEAIFSYGFVDTSGLIDLMKRAGDLRAASHHARTFTTADLRDLRVTWRTIERGLLVFVESYSVEH